MSVRLVSARPVFLDVVDENGDPVAFVGCATDRRTAVRMRLREAVRRGVPVDRIVFTPVPEAREAREVRAVREVRDGR